MTALRLALAALVLSGCLDVCQRAEGVAKRFEDKTKGCRGLSVMTFDVTACEASLSHCTDADLATIDAWYACLDRLPACSETGAFASQVLACANRMTSLTPGCFTQ